MQKFTSINFTKDRNQSFLDRSLSWSMTTGRTIVVITEALALCAFLYRFSLDRQIIDLHGHINDERSVVNALDSNETMFRTLQTRLVAINTLSPLAIKKTTILEHIYSEKPPEVIIEQVQLDSGAITIQATAPTTTAIQSYLKELHADDMITGIYLSQVENKTSTGTIEFGVSGKIK